MRGSTRFRGAAAVPAACVRAVVVHTGAAGGRWRQRGRGRRVIERLWGGDETLVVVSTDLSHYLSYAGLGRRTAPPSRASWTWTQTSTTMRPAVRRRWPARCSRRAHGLVGRLLDLRNSGDTAGDRTRVVGYAAWRSRPRPSPTRDDRAASGGTTAARRGVSSAAPATRSRAPLDLPAGRRAGARGSPSPERPSSPCAATENCVAASARFSAERPLARDVHHHALAAAFRDTRFRPLAAWEFESLRVEVSLLEPAQPLRRREQKPTARRAAARRRWRDPRWRGRRATSCRRCGSSCPGRAGSSVR